jgi:hypothetical protein
LSDSPSGLSIEPPPNWGRQVGVGFVAAVGRMSLCKTYPFVKNKIISYNCSFAQYEIKESISAKNEVFPFFGSNNIVFIEILEYLPLKNDRYNKINPVMPLATIP